MFNPVDNRAASRSMDISHQQSANRGPDMVPATSHAPQKRPSTALDEPPAKKIRPTVEVPAIYSDAVRKKLASTSRTGQACDRCKERKMKCDTNPVACQPCRQKNLRCYTTDRVTGQSRERGQTDRAETELQALRDQHAAYLRRYGPLDPGEYHAATYSPGPESENDRLHHIQPLPERDKSETAPCKDLLESRYVGWPALSHAGPLHSGPVNGTQVDILDGIIDIADFPCEMMDEYPKNNFNIFNTSKTSVMNTLAGYQNITDPRFPSKEQAVQDANTFLVILSQYVPIVHRPNFIQMVNRIYDQPDTVSQAERVQLAIVLAIVGQQMALRNHKEAAEKLELSHHHLHYALTYYRELSRETTLDSMQALALILVHFRNLPKPGYTWGFGHHLLTKVMEAQYHRDPDRIQLPPSENNPLSKELRKRVFHSILGICVTTGCRIGRMAPWQLWHMDVPLPMAIKDSEISENGLVTPLSGSCDFWPCIQLAKLLPLLTEMYNNVSLVRRSEKEYVRTIEILHSKIDAWRRDWDESTRNEGKTQIHVNVAALLVDGWAAEYALNLYHPSLCPTRSTDLMDRHLEICHKQAQRLLKSFHTLSSKYKGVDFTWHSTGAYALGFGITLQVYHKRKSRMSTAQFDAMKNEMKGWMSLMAYADLVLRTRNHLQHIFEPRVRRLEAECQASIHGTSTENSRYQSTSTPAQSTLPNQPFIRTEPSPRPSPLKVLSDNSSIRSSQTPKDLTPLHYTHAQNESATHQWPHPTHYVAHTGSATPTYAAFTTSAPHYSPLPTSLAPLLNDQSGGYMQYPSTTTNPQNEMMMFQPTHYTDAPATMMWPFVSMTPQDHGQPHELSGEVKYN